MKSHYHYLLLMSCLMAIAIISFKTQPSHVFVTSDYPSNYKIHALHIPDEVSFAHEVMPLDEPDLRERMDKELLVNTYWQSNTVLMIKRAHKYFPIIEKILAEEGVPDDFKYLALIESGLENLVSPKGAKGFWQIMRTTGREYGLEVNANVDERYHLELSTRVACAYLKKAKEKLGSWTLAAASYNRGVSGIKRILQTQQADQYADLLLGTETKRYLFRIMAVKEIVSHPERYGFFVDDFQKYHPLVFRTVKVDTAITNIARFSKQMGINYKTMKLYNPWLLENHLNNKSRKLYHIALPVLEGP
ncbi:MAG: lytic transglycosylase domain-containing protein [Flavobacteriaceae bacterium]